MASRIGAVVVGILVAAYAAMSWFAWQRPLAASSRLDAFVNLGFIGAVILLLGVSALFAWLTLRSPRGSDYLIGMDDELRKVVWPAVMPLFDPKTEAWGSTYVVIVCSIFFTVFIYVADWLLQYVISYGLFQSLIFA